MVIITKKELPERHEHDEYITPLPFIDAFLDQYGHLILNNMYNMQHFMPVTHILDPGAGTGNWGNAVDKYLDTQTTYPSTIMGVELQEMEVPSGSYTYWYPGEDYRDFDGAGLKYNLIIGNPPFRYAEEFLFTSLKHLASGGQIMFLLRNQFSESQGRYKRIFGEGLAPNYIIQSVRRISWYYDQTCSQKTNEQAHSMYIWDRANLGRATQFGWLDWEWPKECSEK